MFILEQVINKKQIKDFINFPLKLYKDSKYYVPSLYIDEKKMFSDNYVYKKTCKSIFFLVYDGKNVVGRIQGILQIASNEKWNQKRVRFTRFDSINNQEVANMLFDAISKWALDLGMNEVVGPLGYSDLEREGLLIEGFEELGTYEEQYNYEYYKDLIQNYGFSKEIDWLEFKIYQPDPIDEKFVEFGNKILKRNELELVVPKSINYFIKHYVDDFFDVIDKAYDHIYGTVPFTAEMKKQMISQFKAIVKKEDITLVLDKNKKLIGFVICFSSISKCVMKSKGHITIPFIFRLLKAKYKPDVVDMGLIGVYPEYKSTGVAIPLITRLYDYFYLKNKIEHIETNLILENNFDILNLLKKFNHVNNKKRRVFIKQIK